MVRAWCVLYIFTWTCASRHNDVHFFNVSTSKSGPELRCFVHFDLEMCFAPQRRALFRHLNFQKWREPLVFCTFWLQNVASRHNAVHFFDIWTSKSGPSMVCFVHFDLEMCFAPQRRALFQHLDFQKWSEPGVFCTFWLGNVLRATTGCTFSTSQLPKVVRRWKCFVPFHFEMCFAPQRRALFSALQLPKVVRSWGVLYLLTCKCASRHNGVQLFISHLASWLRTRRFSEPTFRPSWATNHWKNTVVSRLSYLFAHLHLLSSDSFSSTLLSSLCLCPTLLFHLSILSEVWLLNFLRLNIFIPLD